MATGDVSDQAKPDSPTGSRCGSNRREAYSQQFQVRPDKRRLTGLGMVHLPHRADVWEVFADRLVGRDCTTFDDPVAAGATPLYYYGPAPQP